MEEHFEAEPHEDMFGANAKVIKRGNRLLAIKAHVVCRDVNGQVRWEEDAIAKIVIPAGQEVPEFQCEGITGRIVMQSGAGAEHVSKEQLPWE